MSPAGARLRVVFLDIDDTLFNTTDFVQQARGAAVDAMIERGLRAERAEVMEELAGVVAEFGSNDDRHYDRLLQRLPVAATTGTNRDLLVTAGVIAYHNTKWREVQLHPESEELLADVRAAGLRLGIISSGLRRKQMEKILRLGLDRFVEHPLIFITDQVGIAKSNPLLYVRAVAAAGVPAGEAMHVGDHPDHDVDSAHEAGLITVWQRGGGKHSGRDPRHRPGHVIPALPALRAVLREHYGVDV